MSVEISPLRDALAAHLALLDNDMSRLSKVLEPYGLTRAQRDLVSAALYVARVERDVDELRGEIERIARCGAGRD